MTTRERLHELVDQLDEADADRLLGAALALTAARPETAAAGLPAFVGSVRSGHSDTAERAEQILRDGFGGRAAS